MESVLCGVCGGVWGGREGEGEGGRERKREKAKIVSAGLYTAAHSKSILLTN